MPKPLTCAKYLPALEAEIKERLAMKSNDTEIIIYQQDDNPSITLNKRFFLCALKL